MAKAITKLKKRVPDPVEEQKQSIDQLIDMTADSRNALMELLEISQRLQEYGILDAIRAFLNKGHQVSALAVQQINKPGTYTLIKNMFTMIELLSSLEAGKMTNGLSQGIEKATESLKGDEQTNAWGLLKLLKDPDINRALTAGISFLKGFGEHLGTSQEKKSES